MTVMDPMFVEPVLAFYSIGAALVAIAVAIASSIITHLLSPNPEDREDEGRGPFNRVNTTDPNARLGPVYGYPVVTPRLLMAYLEPAFVNKASPSTGEAYICVLSLGAGPLDLGGFRLWADDTPMLGEVHDTDPLVMRQLRAVGGDTRKYIFPYRWPVLETVALYGDGTLIGKNFAGGWPGETTETTRSYYPAKVRTFTSSDDSNIPQAQTRVGCYVADDEIVEASLEVVLAKYEGAVIHFPGENSSSSNEPYTVPSEFVLLGTNDDGKRYVYLKAIANSGGKTSLWTDVIKTFLLSYSTGYGLDIEQEEDGTTYAVFKTSRESSEVITWTGSYSALGEDMEVVLRPGTDTQEPIPVPALKNTAIVTEELTVGTARTYSTENEVNDVIVGIESGPAGFYDMAVHGKDAGDYRTTKRAISIRIKASSASDAPTQDYNPRNGWVVLWDKELEGNAVGVARWFFSCAELLRAAMRASGKGYIIPHDLRLDKYDVEVVGTEGTNALTRIQDDLWLGTCTEVVNTQLRLPKHATVTIKIKDAALMGQTTVWRMQYKGRKVWVPDSAATQTGTDRPTPATFEWSRNPIHCCADFVRDETFGGGQFYGWENVDLTDWIAAAAFDDESVQVSETDETTETRAQVDIAAWDARKLHDHAVQLLVGAEVFPALYGGTWHYVPDQAGTSVMSIDNDDYELGEISATHPGVEGLPNVVEASFTDEEQDGELNTVIVRRPGTDPDQEIIRRTDLTGVRRRSQATRIASRFLAQTHLQPNRVVVVGAGWKFLELEAGDIVTLTSATLGYSAQLFRVMRVEFDGKLKTRLELHEYDATVYDKAALAAVAQTAQTVAPAVVHATSGSGSVQVATPATQASAVTVQKEPVVVSKLTAEAVL